MKKAIFVIIAIVVIIGVSAAVISSNNLVDSKSATEATIENKDKIEPKSFTVGLDESVGFTEKP